MGGDASQWQPNLYRNTTPIYPFEGKPGWNLTTAMADEAIQYMRNQVSGARQALPRLLRARRHARAAPSDAGVDQEDQRHEAVRRGLEQAARDHLRQPEAAGHHAGGSAHAPGRRSCRSGTRSVRWRRSCSSSRPTSYAAYLAYTDNEIGRVIQAVEDMGSSTTPWSSTSRATTDRAPRACATARRTSSPPSTASPVPVNPQTPLVSVLGVRQDLPALRGPWAWAMATPFKWTKQVASHFGGTAQGVAMSWPGHITDAGGIRRQFHHHRHRADHPRSRRHPCARYDQRHQAAPDGRRQHGLHLGQGRTPTHAPRHTTQYFEMLGNRAIYHDGWVAATTPATLPWELSTKPAPDVITGYKWELYHVGGSDPVQRPGGEDAGQAQADAGHLLR
jgi:arylsulfatase A-like enzyme